MPLQTDVLIAGGGPSGVALASALVRRGLRVRVVAPHPPQPFSATYGGWLDDWPTAVHSALGELWTDVRVYTGPQSTPLLRPYAVLNNEILLSQLIDGVQSELLWTVGRVEWAAQQDGEWTVWGQGQRWTADLVIDASGAMGKRLSCPGGSAWQTAYGLLARFRRPPIPPGSMSWMDYRPIRPGIPPSTFLYAMHLSQDRYFVEETSLIARPGRAKAELHERLTARLEALGCAEYSVEAEEWVSFPMNALAPASAALVSFGAAAGLIHPISGFQVAQALHLAPGLARIIAEGLANGAGAQTAEAAWSFLWPPKRRQARQVQLLGTEALLRLSAQQLPPFFEHFFALPPETWRGFLSPETSGVELTRLMVQLFSQLPSDLRRPLIQAALSQPAASARALGRALAI